MQGTRHQKIQVYAPNKIMTMTGEIKKNMKEFDLEIEWNIKDFLSLSEKDGFFAFSSEFFFNGQIWWIVIYPNGASWDNSQGYISLGLCRFLGSEIRQEFFLSLKTLSGKKEYERHCTEMFQDLKVHITPRFISRSELTRQESNFLPSGVLTVICTLKSSKSIKVESMCYV